MSINEIAGDGPAIEAHGLVKIYGKHRALVLQRCPVISKSSGVMGFAGGGLALSAPV
jgi:hypothetical protein